MDMYFECGGDILLSLDEMLGGGDLDPLVGVGGGGVGGGCCDSSSSPWGEDWSSGPPLSLDISGDPPPGIMVNPNTVLPNIKPFSALQIKKEIKTEVKEEDDDDEVFKKTLLMKRESLASFADDNEEDEEEEEEDYQEEEEEEEIQVKIEELEEDDDDNDEEGSEGDEDDEEEEEEEEEEEGEASSSNSRDLWTTLVMKPVRRKTHMEADIGKPRFAQYQIKRTTPGQNMVQPIKTTHQVLTKQLNNHHIYNSHHIQLQNKKENGRLNSSGGGLSNVGSSNNIYKHTVGGGGHHHNNHHSNGGGHDYPKPAYSYSCLIAMALKNSTTGSLPVSEIYNFMCEHFPYFKSAPAGWKNSVRHNLSLNKCFEKIEKVGGGGGCVGGTPGGGGGAGGGSQRKGCLWAMNPSKVGKMDDEVAKWSKKDPQAIKRAMKYPETLEKLERGDMKIGVNRRIKRELRMEEEEVEEDEEDEETDGREVVGRGEESDEEEESSLMTDDDPGTEDEGEVPPSLKPFDARLNSSLIIADNNDLGVEFSEEMYEELGLLQQVLSSGNNGGSSSNGNVANSGTTASGGGGDEDLVSEMIFSSTPSKRARIECVVASPIQRTAIASHP